MRKIGDVCPYILDASVLGKYPIVVSGGLGIDVSFEIEMMNKYNAKIYAYEFIPTSINTTSIKIGMDLINKGRFIYIEKGLSDKKNIDVFLTENPDAISSSEFKSHPNNTGRYIKAECHNLNDVFAYSKIKYIDVLKLNIEGSEYGLLCNSRDEDLKKIGQICVEFHAFLLKEIKFTDKDVIDKLLNCGFKVVAIENKNYTFVRSMDDY